LREQAVKKLGKPVMQREENTIQEFCVVIVGYWIDKVSNKGLMLPSRAIVTVVTVVFPSLVCL